MKSAMITLILACLSSVASYADVLSLQPDAPSAYTVVKGDTLWSISSKFLKDPWKWPQIWGMNKEEIKNPHWIYPGDTIVLQTINGQPHLSLEPAQVLSTIKLMPSIRGSLAEQTGIPPIPSSALDAFVKQPRIMAIGQLSNAPAIIDYQDEHIVVGASDEVWVQGDANDTQQWDIVEPGNEIIDPTDKKLLGYSANLVGKAHTLAQGNPFKVFIDSAISEITVGDKLLPARNKLRFNYVPHAPDLPVQGQILDTVGVLAEAGRFDTVLLNRGIQDGLTPGVVLAIYQPGSKKEGVTIPPTRVALCIVYRAFDKAAYAMVMDANASVETGYLIQNP